MDAAARGVLETQEIARATIPALCRSQPPKGRKQDIGVPSTVPSLGVGGAEISGSDSRSRLEGHKGLSRGWVSNLRPTDEWCWLGKKRPRGSER